MEREVGGHLEDARRLFLQAWLEASDDIEKFLAAHFVARVQTAVRDRLTWLETAQRFAVASNDAGVKPALAPVYTSIGDCYEELGEVNNAREFHALASSADGEPTDRGPFFHGTKADLHVGDMLTPGGQSNYRSDLTMHHIYFTALAGGAGLAAALAKGDGPERVYVVEPTGQFEHDPNVTNKKFPGNPTRSYRSAHPLKIVGEVTDWRTMTPEELQAWREKVAASRGEIIN